MRYLKKILFYLMIILTFTISFSNEENRITIYERENEPAKLKIGVTKLITKELAMDFDPEKKIIYCEVPEEVTENYSIYVSETLDEMPSTSTTNGRKTINNINKYLSKDVKANANFNYRVVDVNDEATGEVKKYLVINCKNPVTSVYLYIVENGTYKMKGLYRGKFNALLASKESIKKEYGTITFSGLHEFKDEGEVSNIEFSGANILVDGKQANYASLNGEFPKKYNYGNIDYLGKDPYYKITVSNGAVGYYSTDLIKFDCNNIKFETEVDLKDKNNVNIGKLTVIEDNTSDYIKFKIQLNDKHTEVDLKISISYGVGLPLTGHNYEERYIDSFRLKIEKKMSDILPLGTEGKVLIEKEHKLYEKESILTADGEEKITLNGDTPSYLESNGNFPKRINFENIDFSTQTRQVEITMLYGVDVTGEEGKGDVTEYKDSKTVSLKRDGTFGVAKFSAKTGTSGEIGNVDIFSDLSSDYIKFRLRDWKIIGSPLNLKFDIKYKAGETILKQDTLTLMVISQEERIPSNTSGTIIIHQPKQFNGYDLVIKGGVLAKREQKNNGAFEKIPEDQAKYSGKLPKLFRSNNVDDMKWVVNWGDESKNRVLLTDRFTGTTMEMGRLDNGKSTDFDEKTGGFQNRDEGGIGNSFKWLPLKDQNGKTVGEIFFTMDGFNESIMVGLRDLNLKKGDLVDTTFTFEYQAYLSENKWETKKKDKLEIIIFGDDSDTQAKINVKNPIVLYDYDSHLEENRKAHLLENNAKTLNGDNTYFKKNTTVEGDQWLDVKDIPIYNWATLKRHRVLIKSEDGESIKYTDGNGKTQSSTFIASSGEVGDKEINRRRNNSIVMFSYDGGRKDLNFGVSKYNFKKSTINARIIHYLNGNKGIESIKNYRIEIPKFDGKPYVSPKFNIRPNEDYIRYHKFDSNTGQGELTIDYGTVGFKDLDIRITNRSGGKGIEIRAYSDVYLEQVDTGYRIDGAKLFFDTAVIDGKIGTTGFKGQDEKETFKMLKLTIPSQEQIIPKGRFKILRAVDGKSPLEVGVKVDTDNDTYFTNIAENLYLETEDSRFIETKIIFENPEISAINKNHWIRVDKSNSTGTLIGENNSSLWGHIDGTVIDVPNSKEFPILQGKKVKLQVFSEEGNKEKLLVEDLSKINGEYEVIKSNISQDSDFILKKYNGTSYIEFSLTKGYDEAVKPESFEFFIRYLAIDDKNKEEFLFDQRYEVIFNEKISYAGDITLKLSNPVTVWAEDENFLVLNGDSAEIGGLKPIKDNSTTEYDSLKWWEVKNGVIDSNKNKEFKVYHLNANGKEDITKQLEGKFTDLIEESKLKLELDKRFFEVLREKCQLSEKEFKESFEIAFGVKKIFGFTVDPKAIYRLNLEIEAFDPRYFGKILPSELIETEQTENKKYDKINKVGVGKEKLYSKPNVNGFRYIDLGTSYRDYLRYEGLRGGLIGIGNLIVESPIKKIVAYPNKGEIIPINGELVFMDKAGNITTTKEVDYIGKGLKANQLPEKYSLKFKVSEEEYSKLISEATYNLYSNGDKNVLSISGANKVSEKLLLEKPLSFKTEPTGLIIDPQNPVLDFGKIGLDYTGKNIEKTATTTINVTSQNSDKFTLNINANGLKIYRVVGETEIDKGHSLDVKDLAITEIQQSVTSNEVLKNFELSGTLTVPNKKETLLGNYENQMIINVVLNPPEGI